MPGPSGDVGGNEPGADAGGGRGGSGVGGNPGNDGGAGLGGVFAENLFLLEQSKLRKKEQARTAAMVAAARARKRQTLFNLPLLQGAEQSGGLSSSFSNLGSPLGGSSFGAVPPLTLGLQGAPGGVQAGNSSALISQALGSLAPAGAVKLGF